MRRCCLTSSRSGSRNAGGFRSLGSVTPRISTRREPSLRLSARSALSTKSIPKLASDAVRRWFSSTRRKRAWSRVEGPKSRARSGSTIARTPPSPSSNVFLRPARTGPASAPDCGCTATARRSRARRPVEASSSLRPTLTERTRPAAVTSAILYTKEPGRARKRRSSAGSVETNSLDGSSMSRDVPAVESSMSSTLQPVSSQPNPTKSLRSRDSPSACCSSADAEPSPDGPGAPAGCSSSATKELRIPAHSPRSARKVDRRRLGAAPGTSLPSEKTAPVVQRCRRLRREAEDEPHGVGLAHGAPGAHSADPPLARRSNTCASAATAAGMCCGAEECRL
mmetsp:Transcript_15650/g.46938  ORF Transcript_15650/g.46938 Transcript_15650/m.46938 type:complete len:338 (-) Transcript_15650:15-1028(-)